jgi:exonuclease 3'-5' domain-containing protein 2
MMNTSRIWAAAASLLISSSVTLYIYHRHCEKKKKSRPKRKRNEAAKIVGLLPSHLQREVHKDQRRNKLIPNLALKRKMYDNFEMLDPQGALLCTISKKKAVWYVHKELADWVGATKHEDETEDRQPHQVQLRFEPKGRSSRSDMGTYITAAKANACVGCGNDGEHHMKHYVVPYCYRNLFPTRFKSHMSHDIVILCPKCYLHCDQATQHRQNQLEGALRTDPSSALPFLTDQELYQIRSMALALLRWKAKLPSGTIHEYRELLRRHLKLSPSDDLTPALLQRTVDGIEYKVPNAEYVPGAKLVVDSLVTTDQLESFIRDWRRHFCSVVQPRFLPEGWSVTSPVSRD